MWGICGGSELTISGLSPSQVQMEKHEQDVPGALAYLRFQVWAANLPASLQPLTNTKNGYLLFVRKCFRGICLQACCFGGVEGFKLQSTQLLSHTLKNKDLKWNVLVAEILGTKPHCKSKTLVCLPAVTAPLLGTGLPARLTQQAVWWIRSPNGHHLFHKSFIWKKFCTAYRRKNGKNPMEKAIPQ